MDYKRKWTNEELIEWIRLFKTKKELRADSYGKYQACLRRGLGKLFNKLSGHCKYDDDMLIDWISKFDKISNLKLDSPAMYQACLRRGLHEYFPNKKTKGGFEVGLEREEIDRLKGERKSIREEKKRLKEEKKRLRDEIRLSKKKNLNSTLELNVASKIYRSNKLENGLIICGRCLEEKRSSKQSSSICQSCYKSYIKYNGLGQDHNKFNVRDQFCNTRINHHDKVFHIGVKVDERTQNYLSLIGYEFIFKDVYED
jgi:hypothetical protein